MPDGITPIAAMTTLLCAFPLLAITALKNFRHKISETYNSLSTVQKMLFAFIVFLLFGALIIALSFTIQAEFPVIATILSSIGTLLAFSGTYTCYTDIVTSSRVINETADKIHTIIDTNRKDATLVDHGITEAFPFNQNRLIERMSKAKSCKILCLYNLDLFKTKYKEISTLIKDGLELEVIMADHENEPLLQILEESFEKYSKDEIRENISKSLHFICEKSCQHPSKMKVRTIPWPTTYSSYIFDNEELWYVPRHASKGKKDPSVFVIRKNTNRLSDFFYEDFKDIEKDSKLCCENVEMCPKKTPPHSSAPQPKNEKA